MRTLFTQNKNVMMGGDIALLFVIPFILTGSGNNLFGSQMLHLVKPLGIGAKCGLFFIGTAAGIGFNIFIYTRRGNRSTEHMLPTGPTPITKLTIDISQITDQELTLKAVTAEELAAVTATLEVSKIFWDMKLKQNYVEFRPEDVAINASGKKEKGSKIYSCLDLLVDKKLIANKSLKKDEEGNNFFHAVLN
jgi:hypothetical protein